VCPSPVRTIDNAPLVRTLGAGVQFYNSGIPEFEPRLRVLVKVLLIQLLGPATITSTT
jgi:hypothetical protein